MDKKIYITMSWSIDNQSGDPVRAYVDERLAQEAVEKTAEAKKEFEALYDNLVGEPMRICSSSERSEKFSHSAKDGYYYETQEMADRANRKVEFYERSDVKEMLARNKHEDYYVCVELRDSLD